MKYLVQVEAVGELRGAVAVEASSNEEALEKATKDPDLITWNRPRVVGQVIPRRSMPLSGEASKITYVEAPTK